MPMSSEADVVLINIDSTSCNNNKTYYYDNFFAHWYFIPRGLEINKV